jgi:Transposase DDE domain
MRNEYGGIRHLAAVIEEDLQDRDTGLSKPQRIGLADLAASAITCRSVNTSELSNVLPRKVKSNEERYRYINRWLANSKIDPIRVMRGFVPEMVQMLGERGQTVVLMLDQSKVGEGFECLMVSIRVGERAIPLAWRVIKTRGEIGFEEQEPLLKSVAKMVPENVKILLAADRFYGTAKLIGFCNQQGWQYRIRLKGNLILKHEGGEIRTGELLQFKLEGIEKAELNESGVVTNIGLLQEEGHAEPWIIAMDCKPTIGKVLDYGMRWGIEALFSDMKTRGFGITKTQLKEAKRIERLMLVLALATYWAVSTGMIPAEHKAQPSKKKQKEALSHTSSKGFENCFMPYCTSSK